MKVESITNFIPESRKKLCEVRKMMVSADI